MGLNGAPVVEALTGFRYRVGLTVVDDGVSTLSYTYNGDGARLAQIVDGLRTDYVQDVAGPLPQVLAATEGGTTTRYLRGLGLIGEQRGSAPDGWQYQLPDALGSVRQTGDTAGAVTLRRSYDPFGALSAVEGPVSTAYGFAGEEQDATTGHLYLRARTYQPAVGRFLQQDRELGTPFQPNTLRRYAYAFNNPVNVVVGYRYDDVGNRTQLIYPDARQVGYTYDGDKRLVEVNDCNTGVTGYQYDGAGRLITTTLPNGVTSVNAYESAKPPDQPPSRG